MVVKITFMILLKFLHVNTQVSGIVTSSKNSLSPSNVIDISNHKNLTKSSKTTTILLPNLPAFNETSLNPHFPSIDSSPSLVNSTQDIFATLSNYIEKWFISQAPSSSPATRPLPVVLRDVTFFQLWKSIGTIDRGNFTLERALTNQYPNNTSHNSYDDEDDDDSYTRRVSQMKAILVKDTRYRSLIKKWITNRRHGRDFPTDNSTSITSCQSCTNQSTIVKDQPKVVPCEQTTCNTSTSKAEDVGNPESRFYDPLMPYPEEYPEEYQTIQNGPALIISRTTYTRIPNVTYTTITMVTLPTYRLVEKAENAFAATLFEERSLKSSNLPSRARCKENTSSDFSSQHPQ